MSDTSLRKPKAPQLSHNINLGTLVCLFGTRAWITRQIGRQANNIPLLRQVASGMYTLQTTDLNNDIVFLERLVVEEPVQDVLGSGSVPHLQCTTQLSFNV